MVSHRTTSGVTRFSGDFTKAADWELCLSLLRTKAPTVQQRAARHLRQYVETAVREMSTEAFARFEDELYQRIFALVRAPDTTERLGGVAALEELIGASSAAVEVKIIKFSNNLSNALRTNTDPAVLVQVSRALGHMARCSAVRDADYVEFEVNRGLEWLSAEQWHRRLAGCLVLKELAQNAPTTFYVKARDFFERICPMLGDTHEAVRCTAAEALNTCLAVLAQRKSRQHLAWFCSIYDAIRIGLGKTSEADIHGALLIVGPMLEHCGDFMVPRFREVCDAVMLLRGYKIKLVRGAVTSLLPRLALFCPDAFARVHLEGTLAHLVHECSKPETRGPAFLALGQLALAVKGHLVSSLPSLVALVQDGLTAKRKAPFCPEALMCIAPLAEALGHEMKPYVEDLLEPMFSAGLSEALIATLEVLERSVPGHQVRIQARLLRELSILLAGAPYEPPGSYPPWRPPLGHIPPLLGGVGSAGGGAGGSASGRLGSLSPTRIGTGSGGGGVSTDHRSSVAGGTSDEDTLVLALRTLGTFRLDGFCLLPFARDCAVGYLSNASAHVRNEAALTCCQLVAVSGAVGGNTLRNGGVLGPSVRAAEEVLERLLHVAVSDPNPAIRQTLLCALDQRFDRVLCQAHLLQTLLLLLGDEDFLIRLDAITVLGRLAGRNPAYLLPPLRQMLSQLVMELQYGTDITAREEATRALCHVLRAPALHRLVRPLVGTLIAALPLGENARLATAALEALGELSLVAKDSMAPHLEKLIPLVMDSMQDQGSVLKREVSLRTLGHLVSSTHYIVLPYLRYPSLMDTALAALRGGAATPWSLRREALRTLGVLGALDPYKYRHVQARLRAIKAGGGAAGHDMGSCVAIEQITDEASAVPGTIEGPVAPEQQQQDGQGEYELQPSPPLPLPPTGSNSTHLLDYMDGDQAAHIVMWEQSFATAQPSPSTPSPPHLTPASEDFYPTVAVKALMCILRDASLSAHHAMVMQAVMFILKSLGLRCIPFLGQILPNILHVVRRCEPGLRDSLLQNLASLASIIRQHILNFLPSIFDLIIDYWDDHLEQVVPLVQEIAANVKEQFRPFVPRLLPFILQSLVPPPRLMSAAQLPPKSSTSTALRISLSAPSRAEARLEIVLNSITVLRPALSSYLHVVVPVLMKLIDSIASGPCAAVAPALKWQALCVSTLGQLTSYGALRQNSSLATRVVQPLSRLLEGDLSDAASSGIAGGGAGGHAAEVAAAELRCVVLDTLCGVAVQLGPRYLVFDRLVWRALQQRKGGTTNVVSGTPGGTRATAEHTAAAAASLERYRRVIAHIWLQSGGGGAPPPSSLGGTPLLTGDWLLSPTAGEPGVRRSPSPLSLYGSTGGTAEASVAWPYVADYERARQVAGDDAPGGMTYGDDDGGLGPGGMQKPHVNQQNLKLAWDVSQRSTREDWAEWIRRFSVELLRESPSPALRSCSALAQVYSPLARELFHAAFVSCWFELSYAHQEGLMKALEVAFRSSTVPPETLQMLLNLAEFMEHDVEALPIHNSVLADLAQKCHAYAKALHYKEADFLVSPAACVESLININKELRQADAALGVLTYAQRRLGSVVTVQESWLAKLGHWERALELYRRKVETDPADASSVIGCMKCLDALGDWDGVLEYSESSWSLVEQSSLGEAATLAAKATWSLGQWDRFEHYVNKMEPDVMEGAYYRAILCLHKDSFEETAVHIDQARKLLDNTFAALLAESYTRAYSHMVKMQELSELEEIMEYRKLIGQHAGHSMGSRSSGGSAPLVKDVSALADREPQVELFRRRLLDKWRLRLEGCTAEVAVWQSILSVRSLVLTPQDDISVWLQLAGLCQRSGNFSLSERVITRPLAGLDDAASDSDGGTSKLPLFIRHALSYALLKHRWAAAGGGGTAAVEALSQLKVLAESLEPVETPLKVKCLLKVGHWELLRIPAGASLSPSTNSTLFSTYRRVTELAPDNYKAWHSWAMVNFMVVEQWATQTVTEPSGVGSNGNVGGGKAAPSVHNLVTAADAFIRAISLGRKKWSALVQQDMLNLLQIWFRHGAMPEVHAVLVAGLESVNLDSWLGVVPQLIARINISHAPSRELLHNLLAKLGRRHPQALVYPLSVALLSPKESRRQAAEALMTALQQHSGTLVKEALLVSRELIRVAILWHEQWHEGLEDASRLYFGAWNVRGMLDTLLPLHRMLEEGPATAREEDFVQSYGRDLAEARECIRRYQRLTRDAGGGVPIGAGAHGGVGAKRAGGGASSTATAAQQQRHVADYEMAINQAWDLYYTVFRKVNKQLPQMTTLELQFVSQKLLAAKNMELAVPGTYHVSGSGIRIRCFLPTVQVIPSKQRPRKITVRGEDGLDYVFLLKGHEDLRQDERVMQLFGQMNALLAKDRRTNRYDLYIQRYAVIPLSHNVGVVGWVPHCDTLHALIRDYRESRRILLNIEHRLITQAASPCEYESLTLQQKVEVFEMALEHTAGHDLYRVLWLKSQDSEAWLDRRTNFTRSLAVMSMVGYILGLGDRHPSNLMLDRFTGKVLHIDFGDCFEVAMQRDKFPEKVPFRLTRMLVNAMEVSGIEGSFRCTCGRVMGVLRESRDSLIAMLEAFVYDPLISWRLLRTAATTAESRVVGEEGAPNGEVADTEVVRQETSENNMEALPSTVIAIREKSDNSPTLRKAVTGGPPSSGSVVIAQLPTRTRRSLTAVVENNESGHELDSSGREDHVREDGEGTQHPSGCSDSGEEDGPPEHKHTQTRARTIQDTVQESSTAAANGDVENSPNGAANTVMRAANGDAPKAEPPPSLRFAVSPAVPITLKQGSPVPGGGGADAEGFSRSKSRRSASSSYRPNLHLEFQQLAASLVTASTAGGGAVGGEAEVVKKAALRAQERALLQTIAGHDGEGGGGEGAPALPVEALNEKAVAVIRRVQDKLAGRDFGNATLGVEAQVDRLIRQATSNENLCQLFTGWCPFW